VTRNHGKQLEYEKDDKGVQALTPEQIAWLGLKLVEFLKPEQIKKLGKEQLQNEVVLSCLHSSHTTVGIL
jgi:hypothetical protein